MDEQLLSVRLAALDATIRVLTGHAEPPTDELVVTYATTIETWLTRPEPNAEPVAHGIETTAEDDHTDWRTRRGLCDTFWRNSDQQLHRCRYAPGHSGDHRCSCSSIPKSST
jgi:hypothetical protein